MVNKLGSPFVSTLHARVVEAEAEVLLPLFRHTWQ